MFDLEETNMIIRLLHKEGFHDNSKQRTEGYSCYETWDQIYGEEGYISFIRECSEPINPGQVDLVLIDNEGLHVEFFCTVHDPREFECEDLNEKDVNEILDPNFEGFEKYFNETGD